MKNLHLIPTEKPSNLYIGDNGSFVFGMIKTSTQSRNDDFTNQHIYITANEEIKQVDYAIQFHYGKISIVKCDSQNKSVINNKSLDLYATKIILTTDPDLISDGVQAIDDKFLEWFVQNPSCEEVEVTRDFADEGIKGITYYGKYFIIIPQEEPKQDWYCPKCQSYVSPQSVTFGETHELCNTSVIIQEPKQETLEEAAKKYKDLKLPDDLYDAFIEGAKWQVERMFNEKDMKQFAWQCVGNFLSNRDNEVEEKLVEVIIDRNNLEFEKFKKK